MTRRGMLIRLTLILLISINLVNNINRQREGVRKRYLIYIQQEFDRDLRIRKFNIYQQFIKPIDDNKKMEEQIKTQKEQEVNNSGLSRGGNIFEETFILTFYTSLNEENGYGPITCNGSKLSEGIVANNVLPQGTRIITNEFGELTVYDRGGDNFNTRHRLDVFISRKNGESDYQYKKRVNAMGIIKVKGYIIK